MIITMVGHSTVLIEIAGLRILTDPYFDMGGNAAYKRLLPPWKAGSAFTDVDLVLVSHNHFDHTDRGYFRSISAKTPVVAPSLTSWVTRLKGAQHIVRLRPWHSWSYNEALEITAVPAWHTTVTQGYVIQAQGETIYFAGDTYNAGFMRRIASRFKPSIVLMPVTTFRIPMTMGEASAAAAAEVLRPEVILPIHLGIAPRSPFMRTEETSSGFEQRIRAKGLSTKVVTLEPGETWSTL